MASLAEVSGFLFSEADLGKALLVHWPLCSLMDFISLVETSRIRVHMRTRSLSLPKSTNPHSADDVRRMNWSLLSGQKGLEVVKDFTTLLMAPPENDILQACRLTFADALPHVFPAMCDAWRRLWLPAQRKKTQLLGVGLMTIAEATAYLQELAGMPTCCIGDPFVQVQRLLHVRLPPGFVNCRPADCRARGAIVAAGSRGSG